ncbi:MAG: hypothetical protein A2297_08530 [Elusimicrobia bacterium RIFOXYB2_FULL_48_7]|nr:MAG: hypothetical protein A2297_08530 [Elusimicrobia bacterium RIFOXYB2_FULL_48_7]
MNKKRSIFTQLVRLVLVIALLGQVLYVPNLRAASGDQAFLILRVGGVLDLQAPQPVTDLKAGPDFVTGVYGPSDDGSGKVKLNWSAPEDMPDGMPVFSYIIKYATFSIYDVNSDTVAWWNHSSVSTVASTGGLPANWGIKETKSPHSLETFILTGLSPSQYYWFAIQSMDNVYNHSGIDTKAQFIVTQSSSYASTSSMPPAPISSLSASPAKDVPGGISLAWTAMGNDGVNNRIIDGKFRVCYSTIPYPSVDSDLLKVNPKAYWALATEINISTSNVRPGDSQKVMLTGLTANVSYYFWVWTSDEWYNKTNWSYESNKAIAKVFNFYPPAEAAPFYADAYGSTDVSSGSYVQLNWKNPTTDETRGFDGVNIRYSTTTTPVTRDDGLGIVLSGLTANAWTSLLQLQLEPRTTYYYRIFTFDNSEPALYSGTGTAVSVCTIYDNLAPDAVTGLALNADANSSRGTYINLNWAHPDFSKADYRNRDWEKTTLYVSTQNYVKNGGYPYNGQAPVELATSATWYQFTQLAPQNTYYFEARTLDTVSNFSVSTASVYTWKDVTAPGLVDFIVVQSTVSDDIDIGCSLGVSWRYPGDVDLDNFYITYREGSFPVSESDGISVSRKLGQGSMLANDSIQLNELVGNTTYYFGLFLYDWSGNMSSTTITGIVSVSRDSSFVPFTPLGLNTSKQGSIFSVTWEPVLYKYIESSSTVLVEMAKPNPKSTELYRYQLYESADMNDWSLAASTKPTAGGLKFSVPVSGTQAKYYKIRAVNISGDYSDSMIVDDADDLNIYSMIGDRSYVKMGTEIKDAVKNVYLKWTRNTSEEKGPVFRSFIIEPYRNNDGNLELYSNFTFAKPKAEVSIKYDNGTIAARGAQMNRALAEPEKWLSMFYFNGKSWQKLTSSVDAQDTKVKSSVKYLGLYQIRYAMNAADLTFYDVMPKIITPNGDGSNDRAFFKYDNPRGAQVTVKIFDMTGSLARTLDNSTESSNVPGGYIYWDGADRNGDTVNPGTYIYQVEGEGKVFNGTVIVAR